MTPLLVVLALAVSQPSPPASAHVRQRTVITEPVWVSEPSREDFAREYPPFARERGAGGRVVIECVADAEGALTDCAVVSETPEGEGFGVATLRLASKYKIAPKDAKGRSIVGFKARLAVGWGVLS
jgi:protein TonB